MCVRVSIATIGFAVALVAPSGALAAPKSAPSDSAWVACSGKIPDQKIAGCSEIIGRGTSETVVRRAIAYNNRGNALLNKNDHEAALRDLDNALLLNPGLATGYNNRGLVYRAKGDVDRAIKEFSRAIELDPKSAVMLTNRGSSYNMQRDADRASRDLDRALELDPKYALAWANRGVAKNIRNDSDGAIEAFNRAIALDPKMAFAHVGRGIAYNAKRDFSRALTDFDQALLLNPGLVYGYNERGNAWLSRGDWVRAKADFEEALRLNPKSAPALNGRGFVAKATGNLTGAVADLDEALKFDGKYAAAFLNRGDAYLKMGENDRAMADFNDALRLDPGIAAARVGRGVVYERRGELGPARLEFEAAASMPLRAASITARAAQETARARLEGFTPALTPTIVAQSTASKPAASHEPSPLPSSAFKSERGPRVALVIGNAAYRNVSPLPNPTNDARLIAQSLRELGFKVVEGHDLDSNTMRSKIAEFGAAMSGAGVTMLFYAGHGMQVEGKNYLIPVDASLERPSALNTEAIEVGTILADMETEKRINLVFLDACRDNPMAAKLARSLGASRSASVAQGLAQQRAGIGTLIAFATSPEMVALDGVGADSPFTLAILKHIQTPGLEIRSMLTRVRADVIEATREQQVPWDHSSLTGEFYFQPALN